MILREIEAAMSLLESCNQTINVELEFQEFVDELLIVVSLVDKELLSITYSKARKRRLRIYLHQLKTILKRLQPVLGPLFKIPDVMKIYSGRLKDCLSGMSEIIEDPDGEEEDEGFIRQVNLIRTLLKQSLSSETLLVEVKSLLVHALTIAKLCTDEGFNEISALCKKVLEVTKSIQLEGCDLEFLVQSCEIHLSSLERQINIAMLQLFLENMSDPTKFVKALVKKCLIPGSHVSLDLEDDTKQKHNRDTDSLTLKTERKPSDLDEFIVSFDLACDRMELLGNYCIASSENDDMRINVEVALSTLGYCCNSLIPAILSYYCNPACKIAKSAAKLLVIEWIETVESFNNILDSLIDPANLVQVAIEDFRCLIDKLSLNEIEASTAITFFSTKCLRIIKLVEISSDLKIPCDALEPLKRKLTEKSNLKRLRYFKFEELATELEEFVQMLDQVTIKRLRLLLPQSLPDASFQTGIFSPAGDIDSAFDLLDAFPSTVKRNGASDFKSFDETPRRQVKGHIANISYTTPSTDLDRLSTTVQFTKTHEETIKSPLNENDSMTPHDLKTPTQTHGLTEKENSPGQRFFTPRSKGVTPGRMLFPILTPFLDKAVGTSPFTPVSFPQRSTHRIVIKVEGDPALYNSPSKNVSESEC